MPAATADPHPLLCRIPVFRPVALKLLRVLSTDDSPVFEIARLLGSDPAFSAEILTMANSAGYAARYPINTIGQAIVTLGLERTKTLAMNAAMQGMLRAVEPHAAVENCWVHSRATALIAESLSPVYGMQPDRGYILGLIHDIGRLGLLAAAPEKYTRLLTQTGGGYADLLAEERLAFSMDHCQAGLWLTKTWSLPKEFWAVASQHHAPGGSAAPDVDLVRTACSLAHTLGYRAAPRIESPAARLAPAAGGSMRTIAVQLQEQLGIPPVPAEYDQPLCVN